MMRVLLSILVLGFWLKADVHMQAGFINQRHHVRSWIEIKNRYLVRQKEDYSCGSASLATLLRYFYGKQVTEKRILDLVMKKQGLTKANFAQKFKQGKVEGLSMLDLGEIAASMGFNPIGLGVDMEALGNLQIPVIVYIATRDNGHFTVYKGMDEGNVYLADPSMGNVAMRRQKFEAMFFLEDNTTKKKNAIKMGKILAILPKNPNAKYIEKFMKLPGHSKIIYKNIGRDLLRR